MMKTVEEMHREYEMKVEICNEILKRIPMCNGDKEKDVINREYWYFIEKERNRNRRMVDAIEKYLL